MPVPSCHPAQVVWTDSLRYSLLYHCFGTVWSLAFVMATADVIIAGAVAHWYFTPPQGGERHVEVRQRVS